MDLDHQLILLALSEEKRSLMIKDIAQKCGINRHTVARKLDTLEILGRVRKIEIGNAKKFFCTDAVPVSGLIDISNDLILVVNEQWEIQYINRSAQILLNLGDQPVNGERLDLLHLDIFSAPAVLEGLKEFSFQKVSKIEIPREQDGIITWYEISIMNLALESGSVSIALIASDITEKIRTKKKLVESEAMYRSLFENAPIPINEVDYSQVKQYLTELKRSGIGDLTLFFDQHPEAIRECITLIQVRNVNKKSQNDFNIGMDENHAIVGILLTLLSHDTLETFKEIFIALDAGSQFYQCELSIIGSDGLPKYYNFNLSVASSCDDLSRIYISYLDVTEQKNLQLKLLKNQRDLIEVTEEVLAHDAEIRKQKTELESTHQDLIWVNQFYSHLLDATDVPVILWDSSLTILWVSNAMHHLLGSHEITPIGEPLGSLFQDEERSRHLANISAQYKTPNETIEVPVSHQSGTLKMVQWSFIERIRTSDGKEMFGAILSEVPVRT